MALSLMTVVSMPASARRRAISCPDRLGADSATITSKLRFRSAASCGTQKNKVRIGAYTEKGANRCLATYMPCVEQGHPLHATAHASSEHVHNQPDDRVLCIYRAFYSKIRTLRKFSMVRERP